MKAVVIGGCGHIGTYLVPMLVRAGYAVVSVTRGKSRPYAEDPAWEQVENAVLDREKTPDFAEKIAAMRADVVVDLISFRLADTKAMAEALQKAGCAHYLFCSSVWAHGRAERLPFDPDDRNKRPLDEYGREKFASELYLKAQHRENGFPATVIMPGQISGPGWTIMNPWANKTASVFQKIADGEKIYLPNFGMETLHHVHGEDVARMFFLAITHRAQALGESFHAVSGGSVTLYGYAEHMYKFFGREPDIGFLPWNEWCDYIGDPVETDDTWHHIARSGYFDLEKEKRLLGFEPKYTNLETIDIAVQSYIDRGLIRI